LCGDRVCRWLRQQGEDLGTAQRGEISSLAHLVDKLRQGDPRVLDQAGLTGAGGEREALPAEPVPASRGRPLDEPVFGQRGEGSRDLALLVPGERGDLGNPEPALGERGVRAKREQYLEPAPEACSSGYHRVLPL
jgi:hypothetical protein